jgi:hypothetical protein
MLAAVRFLVLALFLGASLGASFGAAAQSIDFAPLEKKLRLKPEQKAQFDRASSATQRALVSSAMAAVDLKGRLQDELMKARPDFGALFASQQAAIEMNRPLFREARDEWVKLYELLDNGQTAMARRYIEEQLRGLPTFGLTP